MGLNLYGRSQLQSFVDNEMQSKKEENKYIQVDHKKQKNQAKTK